MIKNGKKSIRYIFLIFFVSILLSGYLPIPTEAASERFILQESSYTPSKVFPGDNEIAISIKIKNTSSKTATDVEARLNLPSGMRSSYAGSIEQYLGDVESKQTVSLLFYIDILDTTEAKKYDLELELDWGTGEDTLEVPFYVGEKVAFVIIDATPNKLQAGAEGVQVKLFILNNSTIEANDVMVEFIGNGITGQTQDFLGTIYANETKYATFELDISNNVAKGPRTINIRLTWVQSGKIVSDILYLDIIIEGPSYSVWLIVIGVIFVAIFFIYTLRKRYFEKKELGDEL
ncbi:hypothetical protein [Candidatus Borrarchaeum sp.]|uniref:hypothetical protein n=1 Tax=Candidatus Borrarchaeum sp. TaxID=2846742 RepID=UPI00257DB4B2|nr:hypothetical protein [Candidatus Borrarchaeum sp.]